MRLKVVAIWSGITSHWLIEPHGKRLNAHRDGLLTDAKRALDLRAGDEVDVEPIDASADSYDESRIANAYLVIGPELEDDFG